MYEDYKSVTVTVNATDISAGDETTDWTGTPAKEVMIVLFSGDSANTLSMKLKIGGTYGDQIDILVSSLPFTISGLLIDQIIFATSDTGTNEVVEVISFH